VSTPARSAAIGQRRRSPLDGGDRLFVRGLHEHSLPRERSTAVAQLALSLGMWLGLAGTELTKLRVAAVLHDMSKLAIPVGRRMLAGLPNLAEIGSIVRAIHEHWDGTGYPDGTAGIEIPRAARIIAICDAYEVMTTTRPHRDALRPAQALEELRRRAGSQFDPKIARVFCDTLVALSSEDSIYLRFGTPMRARGEVGRP
jgi:HD-GYP domain-containing protein (c-di-GMP phosphodiesterase class II)